MPILPHRTISEAHLRTFVRNEALRLHCMMVAAALEAYAKQLGEHEELWYQTGLLHDLDWEMWPDEHPKKALRDLLTDYPEELKLAIAEHAPQRTSVEPQSLLGRYLFATDELSGLMRAASLMRPQGFAGMEVRSVLKKIKDKAFARNVSREDVEKGFSLIEKTPENHIGFLIGVFSGT